MTNATETPFTPIQRRAIEHLGAPLLVIGGPGTGKTGLIVQRACWLIENGHASAFGTLIITFANKAAREAMSRLHTLLPPDVVAKIHVKTFSSFGLELTSTYGDLLGYDLKRKRLRVIEADSSREIVRRIIESASEHADVGKDSLSREALKRLSADTIADLIQRAKHAGVMPDQYCGEKAPPIERFVAEVYRAYQAHMLANNLLDFGDLILKPLQLLREQTVARDVAREVYTNILIDEVQDTSQTEWEIVGHIAGSQSLITAAGDPEQTIHGWRGAMGAACVERFLSRFPDAELITLTENHRSNRHIVEVSGCLLNASSRQIARRSEGAPVALLRAGSEFEEVGLVAGALDALVRCGFAAYADCAVLCRTNAQVSELEKALIRASVPYRVVGRGTFFQRREIQQVLAYLALALEPSDDYALRQIARLHFTKSQIERLRGDDPELKVDHLDKANAHDDAGLSERITQLNILIVKLAELGEASLTPTAAIGLVAGWMREQRATFASGQPIAEEDLALLKLIAQPHATIQGFLVEVETWNGEDPTAPANRDNVQVMTLHSAKGLEFKVSFVIGANEGTLPHYNMVSPSEIDDERRLMLVGLTRGTDLSVVTYSRERHGRQVSPSRFLQGWPSDSVARLDRGTAIGFLEGLKASEAR